MRIPLILADAEVLLNAAFAIILGGVSGLVCLMFAYRSEMKKTPDGRRTARWLLVAMFVCFVLAALVSPLIVKRLSAHP